VCRLSTRPRQIIVSADTRYPTIGQLRERFGRAATVFAYNQLLKSLSR
jgi:hypothetical protein